MRVLPVLALAVRAQEAVSLNDEKRERMNKGLYIWSPTSMKPNKGLCRVDEFRTLNVLQHSRRAPSSTGCHQDLFFAIFKSPTSQYQPHDDVTNIIVALI